MKYLILILFSLFIIACTDEPLNPYFDTEPNQYNGHWEIQTTGDLPGAATIYINSAGEIKNGIPMLYYNLAKVNTYIDGFIKSSGTIEANFYCSYVYHSEAGIINIISATGLFNGSFSDSTANGNYHIKLLNNESFSGTWQAFRLN
jgi:hypothetical protein